jgi:ribosomal protein S19E (S16A)
MPASITTLIKYKLKKSSMNLRNMTRCYVSVKNDNFQNEKMIESLLIIEKNIYHLLKKISIVKYTKKYLAIKKKTVSLCRNFLNNIMSNPLIFRLKV